MSSANRTFEFYFKIPYTEKSNFINIDSSLSISQFIDLVNSNFIKRLHFNINDIYNIELVEACNNIHGDAELAPALQPSEETLEEKYGNNYKHIAFYIRPVYGNDRIFIRTNDYTVRPDL